MISQLTALDNPFQDLQNAWQNIGIDPVMGGFILGAVLVVSFAIVIPWVMDPHGKDRSGNTIFIAVLIGMVLATLFGWFPVWVPFVTVLVLAWIMLDPMGTKSKSS